MTTTRHYYAASWPYGVASNSNTGAPIWNLHRFISREVRDAWVEERPTDYRGNSGYRSAVASGNLDLRATLRRIERESALAHGDVSDYYLTNVAGGSVEEWRAAEAAERDAYLAYLDAELDREEVRG